MIQPFDASVNSVAYMSVARSYELASKLPDEVSWMLRDANYDCGLDLQHVGTLIAPDNWSVAVRNANRKPRVFLDARTNQRGNAEISWARGACNILFDEDFTPGLMELARKEGDVTSRSLGELMWWKNYEFLLKAVIADKIDSAVALLYAHAARLNELQAFIARHVTLVGAMHIEFIYHDGVLARAGYQPTIPRDQLQSLVEDRLQRRHQWLAAAVNEMNPRDL